MNYDDLKNLVDSIERNKDACSSLREQLTLGIVESRPSMGGRALVGVKNISPGFDSDRGSLMIWPEENIIKGDLFTPEDIKKTYAPKAKKLIKYIQEGYRGKPLKEDTLLKMLEDYVQERIRMKEFYQQ